MIAALQHGELEWEIKGSGHWRRAGCRTRGEDVGQSVHSSIADRRSVRAPAMPDANASSPWPSERRFASLATDRLAGNRPRYTEFALRRAHAVRFTSG